MCLIYEDLLNAVPSYNKPYSGRTEQETLIPVS